MHVPFFSLTELHERLASGLGADLARVLSSGQLILGPELERFERAFAKFVGVRHAIGVGNGLDALTLILRSLGLTAGDEVIVPGHTFIATWLAAEQAGATIVPVEVDELTFNIDPEAVRRAISPRTRAIIAVHLYGRPAPMAELRAIADPLGIPVVEDAAQAHGAGVDGRFAGALGRAAAFSFYPTKNLGALGDGGAVTTDDDSLAEHVRRLRNYGSARKYVHEFSGVNSRLDELQAAFLLRKLPDLAAANEGRRRVVRLYLDGLKGAPGIRLPAPDPASVWHLFVVRTENREALQAALAGRGVSTLAHYPTACHRQAAFVERYGEADLPVSERLAREVLSLPLWPEMTEAQVDHVIRSVCEAADALQRPT